MPNLITSPNLLILLVVELLLSGISRSSNQINFIESNYLMIKTLKIRSKEKKCHENRSNMPMPVLILTNYAIKPFSVRHKFSSLR